MSISRKGCDRSDVYLYESANECICCSGCSMDNGNDVVLYTYKHALNHINKHIKNKEVVPGYAIDYITERQESFVTHIFISVYLFLKLKLMSIGKNPIQIRNPYEPDYKKYEVCIREDSISNCIKTLNIPKEYEEYRETIARDIASRLFESVAEWIKFKNEVAPSSIRKDQIATGFFYEKIISAIYKKRLDIIRK